jgi:hypothetical protein
MRDLVVSLDPLPSSLQKVPELTLNEFTPYSALGELLTYGWPVYIVVLALMGAGLALSERLALRGKGGFGGLSRIVIFGTAALFVLQSTEYNLRQIARLEYYGLIIVAVLVFLGRDVTQRPHGRPSDVLVEIGAGLSLGHVEPSFPSCTPLREMKRSTPGTGMCN